MPPEGKQGARAVGPKGSSPHQLSGVEVDGPEGLSPRWESGAEGVEGRSPLSLWAWRLASSERSSMIRSRCLACASRLVMGRLRWGRGVDGVTASGFPAPVNPERERDGAPGQGHGPAGNEDTAG
jgi:hypothetical protein